MERIPQSLSRRRAKMERTGVESKRLEKVPSTLQKARAENATK